MGHKTSVYSLNLLFLQNSRNTLLEPRRKELRDLYSLEILHVYYAGDCDPI